MNRLLKLFIVLVGTILVALFISVMLMVIWPGAMKFTAPILCPDDQPDPFVVRYTTQTSDGTGTNFTLFCMDDRGQFTEIGTWEPLGLLFLFVAAGMVGAVLLVFVVNTIRGVGRGGDPNAPPAIADPFAGQSPIS